MCKYRCRTYGVDSTQKYKSGFTPQKLLILKKDAVFNAFIVIFNMKLFLFSITLESSYSALHPHQPLG